MDPDFHNGEGGGGRKVEGGRRYGLDEHVHDVPEVHDVLEFHMKQPLLAPGDHDENPRYIHLYAEDQNDDDLDRTEDEDTSDHTRLEHKQ